MKDEFDLGNAFETSIEDIWFSKKHIQVIQDLRKGLRSKYSLCSKCPFPPTPPQGRLRLLWIKVKNKLKPKRK
jgi:hypothetical protein